MRITGQITDNRQVDRDTVAKYRKIFQNPPKVPADPDRQNPSEVPIWQLPKIPPTNSSQLRPFVEEIQRKYLQRLTAQRIYQDLVEDHDYKGSYDSVKRYVRKLRKRQQR